MLWSGVEISQLMVQYTVNKKGPSTEPWGTTVVARKGGYLANTCVGAQPRLFQ